MLQVTVPQTDSRSREWLLLRWMVQMPHAAQPSSEASAHRVPAKRCRQSPVSPRGWTDAWMSWIVFQSTGWRTEKRNRILKQWEDLGYQSCLGDRQDLGHLQHFGINFGNIKRQFTEQILTHLESELCGIISPIAFPVSDTWTVKCFII